MLRRNALYTLLHMLLLLCSTQAYAQDVREPGADLTVYLATMGPGSAVWEKFGHNAIWIRDASTRTTIAYDYGRFHFGDDFWPRFLRGHMLYSMGVDDADWQLAAYAQDERTVQLQRLALSNAQKHELREFLEWNWLPQNRAYRYDYFRDNCSTRLRDALDRALGGALRAQLEGVATGSTFRSHSLRLTAADPLTFTGLVLGLGRPTDVPIDAWEETFVPMELMRHIRAVNIPGPDGQLRPLVAEEVTAFEADRATPPDSVPQRWPWYLLIAVAAAAGLLLLARSAPHSRRARFALGAAIFFWSVVAGVLGLVLAILWVFTDHTAAYPNVNLFQMNPLSLVLSVVAPLALIRPGGPGGLVRQVVVPVAVAVAAVSFLGLLLQLFAGARQHSFPIIALALPIHCAVVLSLFHAFRADSSGLGDSRRHMTDSAAI